MPHEVLVSREIYKHIRVLKGREYSLALSCRAVVSKGFEEHFGQPKDDSQDPNLLDDEADQLQEKYLQIFPQRAFPFQRSAGFYYILPSRM